jgi:hypothetical protein
MDKVELKIRGFGHDHSDFGHAIVMETAFHAGLASLG